MTCITPQQEMERISALQQMGLMDTPPEPEFDELVVLAAAICEAPISLVSLLDDRRQWFKAVVGLDIAETDREVAFCSHTIEQSGVFVVEDAEKDARFAANPLVTGEVGIRFYAGMPVHSPDGHALGSLCVIDRKPRKLTSLQLEALSVLSRQVTSKMELRLQRMQLQEALEAKEKALIELQVSQERFQLFMDSGPFLSYVKAPDGKFTYYNQRMAEQFRIGRTDWLGKSDFDFWPEEVANEFRQHDLSVMESRELQIVEEQTKADDGQITHWRSYKFPYRDEHGTISLGGFLIDVTEAKVYEQELMRVSQELRQANEQLRSLSVTDALTGLGNRRVFEERMAAVMKNVSRGRTTSLLMIDIDYFKQRNDRFGHLEGDKVLQEIGNMLRREARESDLAVRLGGDEFAVLLPEASEAEAVELGQRLNNATRVLPWHHETVTLSIGAAQCMPGNTNAADLIAAADAALYAAKVAGRNRVCGATALSENAAHAIKRAA